MSNECTLTDQELTIKIDSLNGALCKSGGKSWRLSVPPDVNNDPDLLIAELVKRFERAKLSKDGVRVWVSNEPLGRTIIEIWANRPIPKKNGVFEGTMNDANQLAKLLKLLPGECKAFEIRECL